MKKNITLDAIIASLFGAIGYWVSYFLAIYYGCGKFLSIVICMLVGRVFDVIVNYFMYSSKVQNNIVKKIVLYAICIFSFLAAGYAMIRIYEHSLFVDVSIQYAFMFGFQLIGFCISFGIRYFKKMRLIKKYGSGDSGFLFDEKIEKMMKGLIGDNKELAEYTGKNPIVKTMTGTYVGKYSAGCVSFLGIPYASAERWKKPVPIEASDKIFEAYHFGPAEIQPASNHNLLNHFTQSEECLNLNVWTKKLDKNSKKPVIVYIHGGDGRYGGSASPLVHLEKIAKSIEDAVHISINYRFGLFGVVDFSDTGLSDASEYSDSTAISLLDQIEALKWIRQNVAFFGGDPENISVIGDTTGGTCVCMLAAMNEAKGLFKRVLILGASSQNSAPNDEIASMLGKKLVETFGAKSVADLKSVTAEQLREFSTQYYDLIETPPRDGRHAPQDITKAYLDGAASGIEFIFGFASDDISSWKGMLAGEVDLDCMMDEYYEQMKKYFGGDTVDKMLEKYEMSGLSSVDAKWKLLEDFQYKAAVLNDCKALSKSGCTVRCFLWDVKGDIKNMTANTVSMLTAFLGNREIAEQMGYLHEKVMTVIMQSFVNKYIHGQPIEFYNNELKGVSKITWDEFDEDRECVLHIQKNKISMMQDAFSENVHEIEKFLFE